MLLNFLDDEEKALELLTAYLLLWTLPYFLFLVVRAAIPQVVYLDL
jgi:hypothetical protein